MNAAGPVKILPQAYFWHGMKISLIRLKSNNMKSFKKILPVVGVALLLFTACEPKQGTMGDKEAVKGDSIDMREGAGEGEEGEEF